MLREIRSVRQDSSHNLRRWFTDADMDLFIWFNNQVPAGFQLSAGKRDVEYAISWQRERGLSLSRVDDGEGRAARYKMSPIMIHHTEHNLSEFARNFLAACELIDPTLADFIYARLLEHPQFRPERPDQDAFSANRQQV